jgi:hypothetical protein
MSAVPRDEFSALGAVVSVGLAGRQGRVLSMLNGDHERWRDGDRVVDLDVSWLVPVDLATVDALARLQVAASHCGRWLQFHGADGGLVELVDFVGLGDVVHLCPRCRSSVQCCEPRPR